MRSRSAALSTHAEPLWSGGWNDRNDKGGRLGLWCWHGAEGQSPVLSLKLHRRERPRITLTLHSGMAVRGLGGRCWWGTLLLRSKLPHVPLAGERCLLGNLSTQWRHTAGPRNLYPIASAFTNCQVAAAKIDLALWCQPQLRGCAYIFLSYTNWHSK